MNYFRAFALAFNMLTIIPFFQVHHFFKGINGYSALFYPLIGFILGSVLYTIHLSLYGLFPFIHEKVIIFVLWITLTGALHLDGFSDTVDGLFVTKEKSLEIMKDSHVGGMGMIFSVVFLGVKLSSFLYLNDISMIVIILMLSRFTALIAIYSFPYISQGVGRLLKDEFHISYFIFAFIYTFFITTFFTSLEVFLILFLLVFIIGIFFTKRIGGLNGDIYGFIIELSELFLLNYFIIKEFV